jgi:hypothetical protein
LGTISTQIGVSTVAVVPGGGKIIANSGSTFYSAQIVVYGSSDDGTTWQVLNKDTLKLDSIGIGFSNDPSTFFVSGGLYKTTNGGTTFAAITGPAPAIKKGYFDSEVVSVGPDGMTVLTNIHETKLLYRSTDGAKTWDEIGSTLPSTIDFPAYPLVLDESTHLVGCSYAIDGAWDTGGGTAGIYRTTNGGASWTQVSNSEAVGIPTAVGSHIFWSFQANNSGGMVVSADHGSTWTVATQSSLNPWVTPIVMPDGRIATLDAAGNVVTSADGAAPWTPVGPALSQANLQGVVYEPVGKAFFAWTRDGALERLKVQ